MQTEELEKRIAESVLTRALKWFRPAFVWWNYSSPYQDHRGFQVPRKAVTSYKMMNFGYEQWCIVFGAKQAMETPGNFAENFLKIEFGAEFAKQYLSQAVDKVWLEEVKILYEQVMNGLHGEPDGLAVFERWERQMIEDGYYKEPKKHT